MLVGARIPVACLWPLQVIDDWIGIGFAINGIPLIGEDG